MSMQNEIPEELKPWPRVTEEMVEAYIIAQDSADRRLCGFHNLGRHFILDGTKEVWFTASDDYEVGHAAMMEQLKRIKVEQALSAALSLLPTAEVSGAGVKVLEWRANDSWQHADSIIGTYTVRPCLATNFAGQWVLSLGGQKIGLLPSEDQAKSGAQFHLETRILSSLSPSPVGREPVGYCVWINGKLAGCAKSHRDSFPVYAAPQSTSHEPTVEDIAAMLYEAANPTMSWSYLYPSHNNLHATVRQRYIDAAARFQDACAEVAPAPAAPVGVGNGLGSWDKEHRALGRLIDLLDEEPSIGDAEMATALEIARCAWDHSRASTPTPKPVEGERLRAALASSLSSEGGK